MFLIREKRLLAPGIGLFVIDAPLVAAKARPGHFIIVRASETGERIPLTIMDHDAQTGSISIVVQAVGSGTQEILDLQEGQFFLDLLGPLGTPVEIGHVGTVLVVGGGLGVAPLYPKAKALHQAGNTVFSIIGARNQELVILQPEMAAVSQNLEVFTDDGSAGEKGLVTVGVQRWLEAGGIDEVIAIGPVPMMRAVVEVVRPFGVPVMVSLNPIMVDGTGMCGGCRVTVGGQVRFACVDGPAFDGLAVDFNELSARQRQYRDHEHRCRVGLGEGS